MTRLRFSFTLAIISTLMRCALVAQEQPAWEINALTDEGSAIYDFQAGITTATNGVIIKRGNAVLTANGVTVYHQTGEVFATGNVRIEQGDQLWMGDEMRYNFNTHQMEGRQFRTGMPPVFVSGQNLHSANTNGAAHTATNGYFTTDDVTEPGHRLRASKIRIVPGRYVEAWNTTLFVGKVPVFYFPYYRRHLGDRVNFFRVVPGYRSQYGPFLLTSYYWYLGDDWDGILHLDYRIDRGIGLGPDVNFHLGRWGEGALKYYYLNDLAPGTNIPPNRHRLFFTYLAEPLTNFTVRSVMRYESDMRLLRDFFENEYRSNPQQPTFVEANKLWENFSLDGYVQSRVNEFQETVERLPEVKIAAFRQQLGPLPVYYEGESSAGFYRRLFAQTNGPVIPDFYALRADTFHQLTVPITLFGWLNLTPRVGGRFSYYGETDGPGATNNALSRAVFNTGVEFSFKASRIWPAVQCRLFDLDGLRHIVEPSVNYVFVPAPSRRPHELPQFDNERPSLWLLPVEFPDYNSLDSIDSQNVLRFGLRNRIQTKRLGRVVDFLDWQLYTDWRLQPQHGQKTFSDIYSDFSLHPRAWLTAESFTRFDVNNGRLRLAFHTITLRPNDTWSWSLGHYYLQSDNSVTPTSLGQGNNLFTSMILYRPTENWSFTLEHRFDLRTGNMEEQDYTVYRDFRSWTGAVTFRVRDNQGGPQDYTMAVTFSFKAHPHSAPSPVQNMEATDF